MSIREQRNTYVVFTDAEADDCVAIFLLYHLILKFADEVTLHIVVDECSSNFDTLKVMSSLWNNGIRFDGKPAPNVKVFFYKGLNSKPEFPKGAYGLTLPNESDDFVARCPNWKDSIKAILLESPCTILVLKPPLELLELMKDCAFDLGSLPAIYKRHAAVWYGSFNIRSLYFDKKAIPSEVLVCLHMFGGNYLYETIFAVGEDNTVTSGPTSLRLDRFHRLPGDVINCIYGWNDYIAHDCLDTIKKEVSEEVLEKLQDVNFDFSKLDDPSKVSEKAKRNCKPLNSIMTRKGDQFVNADTGAVMSLLMPEFYRQCEYFCEGDFYLKPKFQDEYDETENPLYVFYAEKSQYEQVKNSQIGWINKAIDSYRMGV